MKQLQKNKDISHFSNFKTKAQAQYFFEIQCEDDVKMLQEIIGFAKQNKLPLLFIGGWTNMLFAFEIFEWIVIKNSLQGWKYDENTKILEVFSNELISDIAESLEKDFRQDLWHRFIGLPGSVWGAIFGNAGCFGLETENNLVEVTAYNLKTWQIEILWKEDCEFSYRNSVFKQTQKYFIIKATFDLSEKIEKYHSDVDNLYFREHKQPKWNTCGSFFKNPTVDRQQFFANFPQFCEENVKSVSAGFLLEQSWFKGFHLWKAFFSDLHSNFLMSEDNGNYRDLLDLITLAQKTVQEKFGIALEPEVRIVWENWELRS